MTSAAQEGPAFAPHEFDALSLGRLTWLGLILAAIGWALLLGEAALADVLARRAPSPTFHADLLDIAKCLIGSGFGLAIVGGLQNGFGALNRFFAAVLLRSSQRHAPAAAMAGDPAVVDTAAASREAPAAAPRDRRPYRLLADGAVEVETIVGTRRFDSMSEAREFI